MRLCIIHIHTYSIATVVCMLSVLKSMHDSVVVVGCLFLFLLFSSHCLLPVSRVACIVYMECRLSMLLDNSTVAQHTKLPRDRTKSERECMFDKIVGISCVRVFCWKMRGWSERDTERMCIVWDRIFKVLEWYQLWVKLYICGNIAAYLRWYYGELYKINIDVWGAALRQHLWRMKSLLQSK